jgi:SAM-dependent methyltransferase
MDTSTELQIKKEVRQFYDEIGWQEIGEGVYQNARYEDLRPVSRDYIHRCHLRVRRHLHPDGEYLLDAGSGPIQYPEYLEYSQDYNARVCVDISWVALKEARKRIGDRSSNGKGLFVVADVANLPFAQEVFDGVVSLHTIHHLPIEEHGRAYQEIFRVLSPARSAVVVNGWPDSAIMRLFVRPIKWKNRARKKIGRNFRGISGGKSTSQKDHPEPKVKGTYVSKHNLEWLEREVSSIMPLDIVVWRSVSVRFLRAYIHQNLGGEWLLRRLYQLEERFPRFMGKYGQYPLIVINKR